MLVAMSARTIAVGDIHGQLVELETLLARLPPLQAEDTLLFIGDYLDRGPQAAQVVRFLREELPRRTPARLVTLRGNHEDAWLDSLATPNIGFLLPEGNGCRATLQSFVKTEGMTDAEVAALLFQPKDWLPVWVQHWMRRLPTWYEDAHGIYVHAGLEGEGTTWLHPSLGAERNLLWMRESDFYIGYSGKRLVFGHTLTTELPVDHLNWFQKIFDDVADVWFRGDLIGVDTGCGKGGFLSAVELPSKAVYESR